MRPGPWGACVGASVHRWCAVRTRATKELPGELYACSGLGRERVGVVCGAGLVSFHTHVVEDVSVHRLCTKLKSPSKFVI